MLTSLTKVEGLSAETYCKPYLLYELVDSKGGSIELFKYPFSFSYQVDLYVKGELCYVITFELKGISLAISLGIRLLMDLFVLPFLKLNILD